MTTPVAYTRPKPLAPTMGLVYGKTKWGKTTTLIYAFPDGIFGAAPGALEPAVTVCGIDLPLKRRVEVLTIPAITDWVQKLKGRGVSAFVADDFTLIVQQSIREAERKFKGWKLWRKIRNDLMALREEARVARIHVWFNAHQRPPHMTRQGPVDGGPNLPGSMPEDFPAMADMVLRVLPTSDRVGWPYAMSAGPIPQWIVGDRHNVVGQLAPFNLGEALRLAGFDMPRGKGRDFMEALVERIADELVGMDQDTERATIKTLGGKLLKRYDLPTSRWILQDAIDRVAFWRRADPAFQLQGFWTDGISVEDTVPLEPLPSDDDPDKPNADEAEQEGTAAS